MIDDDGRREHPEREAAEAGLAPLGQAQVPGDRLHRSQRREEDARHERDAHGQQRIERQVLRHEGVARGVREERLLAEEGDEHRVGDDARQDARDERIGLEVVAVQDLDGEERGPERRAEDGRHARRRAGDEQDAALAVGDPQQLPDERADGAAHLHRRPLASARAARAERERRHERLHEGDALAHDSLALVEGAR